MTAPVSAGPAATGHSPTGSATGEASPIAVAPMFAAPFATLMHPDAARLNADLLPILLARATEARRDPAAPRSPELYESVPDVYQGAEPAIAALRGFMLGGVLGLVAQLSAGPPAFDPARVRLQARAWLTIVQPEGAVPARSHPMASWCAMYCVQAPELVPERRDGGALRFYDPRLANVYSDDGNAHLLRPYGYGSFGARSIAGQLVMFPAHLLHEIAPLRGATALVTVTATCRLTQAAAAAR